VTRAERFAMGFVSVAAWTGLLLQADVSFTAMLGEGLKLSDALIRFFSYFTILTNGFIAIDGAVCALGGDNRWTRSEAHTSLETCLAVSIFWVAVVFALLLRGLRHLEGIEIVADGLLHTIVPILYLIYWGVYGSRHKLHWFQANFWPIYPLLYFIYALVEGWRTGLYPYPFIDATRIGYERTLINGGCLLLVFWLGGFVFIGLGRLLHPSARPGKN
jgi:hypothetical protein